MRKIVHYIFSDRFFPFILAILVIVSYGLFAPFMGLFMDDVYIVWFKHVFGATQFIQYFAGDRPFMSYFYVVVFNLLGNAEQPIVWQLFGLFTRWLCSYALWGMLNTLWPKARRQNIWVCLLTTVFPGFSQHWIVIIYSFFYSCLAGLFFSMTLMLKAIRERKHFWFFYLSSIIITTYCMAAPEFYAGLELIRGGVLWIEFSRTEALFWPRVKRTIRFWGAYLFILITFMIWRGYFYVSANHQVYIPHSFLDAIISLANFLFLTIRNMIYSWGNPFQISNYPPYGIFLWSTLFLILAIILALIIWQKQIIKSDEVLTQTSETRWQYEALSLSIFSIIVSIIPFWTAGLLPDYNYPSDRFMLAFIFGGCLLLVALLEFIAGIIKKIKPVNTLLPEIIIISFIVAFSAGYQFILGYHYKNLWLEQTNLYWQMVWRMPGIEPGTTIMTYQLPDETYVSNGAITAELNWTYSDGAPNRRISYEFIILNTNSILPILPTKDDPIKAHQPFEINFRTYQFEGNTDKSILITYENPGCLRVVDNTRTPLNDITWAQNPKLMFSAQNLSDPDLISDHNSIPIHPPFQILGQEPDHTWCYYFEKADLASQLGDYKTVTTLFKEATENNYSPQVQTEYYPFIDAFARTGDWQEAYDLTKNLDYKNNLFLNTGLCHVWSGLSKLAQNDPNAMKLTQDMINNLNCSQ
jgi:hypothetical protein